MSDGSDSHESENEDQEGPMVDWGQPGQLAPRLNTDDEETITYSLHYNDDSGHEGLIVPSSQGSVASSHGTMDEFIRDRTCRICQIPPTLQVAHVIWSNWVTFRQCRFTINGQR